MKRRGDGGDDADVVVAGRSFWVLLLGMLRMLLMLYCWSEEVLFDIVE